jgi:hypothetical protein
MEQALASDVCPAKLFAGDNMPARLTHRCLTGSPSQPYIRATLANASKCLSI